MPKPRRSPAERQDAWRRYVLQGSTLEAIAVECAVPLGTLKRWAASGYESPDKKSWHEQRAEIARNQTNIISRLHHLAGKAIADAVESGEAKDVFAAVAAAKALQGEGDSELRAVRVELEREKLSALRAKREAAVKAESAVKAVTGRKELTADQRRMIRDIYGLASDDAEASA
jgi:hypothetical protein